MRPSRRRRRSPASAFYWPIPRSVLCVGIWFLVQSTELGRACSTHFSGRIDRTLRQSRYRDSSRRRPPAGAAALLGVVRQRRREDAHGVQHLRRRHRASLLVDVVLHAVNDAVFRLHASSPVPESMIMTREPDTSVRDVHSRRLALVGWGPHRHVALYVLYLRRDLVVPPLEHPDTYESGAQ